MSGLWPLSHDRLLCVLSPPSLPPSRDPSSYLFHSSCLLLPLLSLFKASRGEGTLGLAHPEVSPKTLEPPFPSQSQRPQITGGRGTGACAPPRTLDLASAFNLTLPPPPPLPLIFVEEGDTCYYFQFPLSPSPLFPLPWGK